MDTCTDVRKGPHVLFTRGTAYLGWAPIPRNATREQIETMAREHKATLVHCYPRGSYGDVITFHI